MHKKEKKKMGKFEIAFTLFSLIFLIGFSCFYGYRMFYYKNKLAPKGSDGKEVLLLSTKIKENVITSGDGLYNDESNYVFRGKNVNNYVLYSNMLFRIIKINKDNTIELVLDDTFYNLSFDIESTSYYESDLNKYLNDIFLKNIKSDALIESTYCTDKINDINKITCNEIKVDYVKLLSIKDYLNSKTSDKSYLENDEIIWLNNGNENEVWLLNNGNFSLSKPSEIYKVKPVITLNNLVAFKNGDGSKDNPYIIENKTYFSSYVKLGNDLYRIYDSRSDVLKLQSENIYNSGNTKYQLSNNSNLYSNSEGLGLYLNTTLYEELEYKDHLVECETYTGQYNSSYKNIYENSVKGKVGITSIIDPLYNKEKANIYFSTPYEEENVYIFNETIYPAKPNIVRNVSLSICINKNSIKGGSGTIDDAYILDSEVQK